MCIVEGIKWVTYVRNQVGHLCSGGARFKFQSWHRLSCLRFLLFSSVPPGKCWYSTMIMSSPLPSKSFPICHSPMILSFDAMYSEILIPSRTYILRMEAVCSSGTLVLTHQTTRCHNAETAIVISSS
jgi:hypothetical protein